MIRIRRLPSKVPFSKLYEIEIAPHGWPETARSHLTRGPSSVLLPLLGVGDAWSFINAADRQWTAGNRGWAVEFEEELGN
jgi:hypothetical protein